MLTTVLLFVLSISSQALHILFNHHEDMQVYVYVYIYVCVRVRSRVRSRVCVVYTCSWEEPLSFSVPGLAAGLNSSDREACCLVASVTFTGCHITKKRVH